MLQEDIELMQYIVDEYGAREVLRGMIHALENSSNILSDLGLKDEAINNAEMAELLHHVDESLGK